MKKFILPIILLLTAVLLLSSRANAQTREECQKTRARASYNCLTEWTKCYYACVDRTKDVSACYKTCKQSEDACDKRVDVDYKACLAAIPKEGTKALTEANAQPKTTEEVQQLETPKQDENPLVQVVKDWPMETKVVPLKGALRLGLLPNESRYAGFKTVTGKNLEETLNWQPIITKEAEQRAWREFLPIYLPGEENITILEGEGEIKSSTSPQFIPIAPKGGDTVQVTYLDSTVRSSSDAVQLRYTWSPDSGAVINVPKRSEVKFREPAKVEGFTSHTVELGQGEIEVKVRNNKPDENQFGVDAGWLGLTVSRTHFWVSQSKDKKMAVIGVYEGEVEVKTSDGKTVKVAPVSDKPGVIIITRRLSIIKLAIVGVILAVVIGGAILRKKIFSKTANKKKG